MNAESQRKFELLQQKSAPYRALLYDVDGTLADNMAAHRASYVATAGEYGIDLDGGIVDELAGWPTVAVAEEIGRRYGKKINVLEFAKRKSAVFIEQFIQQTLPVDHVFQHLLANIGQKKIGLVSGGSRSTLRITLDVIQLTGTYETLVCAGDTPEGKPSPQPFLLAAEQLGVTPQECLVFEDGDPGVQGAIAAGMAWVRTDQL
ncbi:HAD family hydrolase [Sphingobacterium paludis]|uniref:HAD superfamily hydrolase (TIGR01509 family)/HAD superfamily hydrolase (TIGR01549 family) n=1 Tax=Sphingobacterium paludis TaxID=1476465 RepID=A0A4R7DCN5_9SPHI|nr:HAD-IA family hydrolase [Sphingobacterium paludis]TDS17694.1 HAD superfamily hydrolase (TIGR01509 family)/HAD superfamily hydrolase (TIGR01549 family) [Sphingobacterium paludis]